MENINSPKFNFYVIAPFNSKMVLDHTSLIGKYEKFRKLMYQKLNKIYPNQIVIEKFKNNDNPIESINNWLNEDEFVIKGELDDLIFIGTGTSGETQKDKSIIKIKVDRRLELPINVLDYDLFREPPIVILESISFHEYGIGTIFCKLEIKFKQNFLTIKEIDIKKTMSNFIVKIITYPELLELISPIGKNVFSSYQEILNKLLIDKPVITYEELFTNQKSDIPIWGHIIYVTNRLENKSELSINSLMEKLIDISHPEGPFNFSKGLRGFVHTGWGNSLWIDLDDTEINFAEEILRFVEIEFRTLQVFNEVLYRRLNQLATQEIYNKRKIKKTLDWISKLRIEMELYSVNKSNYLQNLAPFAHFIYNGAVNSWRISQMEDFFKEKLEVFEYLYNQGREKINEINTTKINNILFIFTCISLVSTFIDGLMFIFAEHIGELIWWRLFLLIFPPVAFIVLIILIIERMVRIKRKDKLKKKKSK